RREPGANRDSIQEREHLADEEIRGHADRLMGLSVEQDYSTMWEGRMNGSRGALQERRALSPLQQQGGDPQMREVTGSEVVGLLQGGLARHRMSGRHARGPARLRP